MSVEQLQALMQQVWRSPWPSEMHYAVPWWAVADERLVRAVRSAEEQLKQVYVYRRQHV